MIPFGLRILNAELPHYLGRSDDSIQNLYKILSIVQNVLKNLEHDNDGLLLFFMAIYLIRFSNLIYFKRKLQNMVCTKNKSLVLNHKHFDRSKGTV